MDDIQTQPKKSHTLKITLAIVLLLAVLGYGAFKYMKRDSAMTVDLFETRPTMEETGDINRSKYLDGTYTQTGDYISPGGAESIEVTLTIENDIVTSASIKKNATRPTSIKKQTAFEEGFSVLVVGKNLDEVLLDKVSGSSLTPKGFNDAVDKIKVQAQG